MSDLSLQSMLSCAVGHAQIIRLNYSKTLTDRSLAQFSSSTLLRELQIKFCSEVDGSFIKDWVADKAALPLAHFAIRGNKNIRDEHLEGLASVCPSLTYLDISQCDGITVRSLSSLLETCQSLRQLNLKLFPQCPLEPIAKTPGVIERLTYLNLHDCPGVDDSSVLPIFQRGAALSTLKLSGTQVGLGTLECVHEGACPQLTRLEMRAVKGVTLKQCRSLREVRPMVEVKVVHLPESTQSYWDLIKTKSEGVKRKDKTKKKESNEWKKAKEAAAEAEDEMDEAKTGEE